MGPRPAPGMLPQKRARSPPPRAPGRANASPFSYVCVCVAAFLCARPPRCSSTTWPPAVSIHYGRGPAAAAATSLASRRVPGKSWSHARARRHHLSTVCFSAVRPAALLAGRTQNKRNQKNPDRHSNFAGEATAGKSTAASLAPVFVCARGCFSLVRVTEWLFLCIYVATPPAFNRSIIISLACF